MGQRTRLRVGAKGAADVRDYVNASKALLDSFDHGGATRGRSKVGGNQLSNSVGD